jgi:ADP-heptose:LPS heptosyltransferase
MSINIDKVNTVLTLMPDKHMGNLVVSLPAIDALIKHFQGKEFCLIIDNAYREIVESILSEEHIKFYPRKQFNTGSYLRRALSYIDFMHTIRKIQPNIAIDLQGGHTSSFITLFSGASSRLAGSFTNRPYAYNRKVNLSKGKHKVYSYLEIAAAVGAPVNERAYRLQSTRARRVSLENKIRNIGLVSEKRIVTIHPGAGRLQKLWTVSGFATIADWLAAGDYQVVFVGGPGELERTSEIISLLSHQTFNLVGILSLGELMALFEMSSLFLGNDSGPMHLAAAVGTPVVAMFGYADETRWGPRCDKAIVLRGEERCEDCSKKECLDPKCINTLSSDAVKHAIETLLQEESTSLLD